MTHAPSLSSHTVATTRHASRAVPATSDVAERRPSPPLRLATLFGSERAEHIARLTARFMTRIGASLDLQHISATLARIGTVGRIGVPRAAATLMYAQCVMLGNSFGASPLAPVTRLWRGLQRRADVVLDVRPARTLPGSGAALAGMHRDVLLVSHRLVERAGRVGASDVQHADQWSRAREAAEHVYRMAAAEDRDVLLVLPVGRGTATHQLFTDALERHARLHRLPAPRTMKAGLLAALLSGDSGQARWLVASVMPIDELSALATEAIGDTGPWPVMSIARDVTFYDLPSEHSEERDASAMLLAMASLLHRSGQPALAGTLVDSVTVTLSAAARMREELGGALDVPADAVMEGVVANWGRALSAEESGARSARDRIHRRMLDASLG